MTSPTSPVLTDEQIEAIFQSVANDDPEVHIRFARAIERNVLSDKAFAALQTYLQANHPNVNKGGGIAQWALASLAAAREALAVPEGWKLVPIDPTVEMVMAAVRCAEGDAVYKVMSAGGLNTLEAEHEELWAAFLAATPSPQGTT